MMPLVLTEAEGRPAVNGSYFASINPADGRCLLEKYSNKFSGCSFGLLGNLYACEGKSGKVTSLIRSNKMCGFLSRTMVHAPGFHSKTLLSNNETPLVVYELKPNYL